MAETPSWLQSGNDAAPAPVPAAPAPVGSLNVETTTSNTATTEADDKDLPAIILMMRLLNMGVAGAIIAISVRQDDKDNAVADDGHNV